MGFVYLDYVIVMICMTVLGWGVWCYVVFVKFVTVVMVTRLNQTRVLYLAMNLLLKICIAYALKF